MFYVYILKNPLTHLPFYVGVGKDRRGVAREKIHIREAIKHRDGKSSDNNKHKLNTILGILDQNQEVEIEILRDTSFEDVKNAFLKEIELISYYGRRDLGTGILTNMTDGGEGAMNPSHETRISISNSLKGKSSSLKGKKIGPYSEERKKNQKEKMKATREMFSEEEKEERRNNRSKSKIGHEPWNKGKTKETDERVSAYATAKVGRPRPDMIGKKPWNTGKKCPQLGDHSRGKPSPNKGRLSPNKGKTYEEIHGREKAAELKELRRVRKLQYWADKKPDK